MFEPLSDLSQARILISNDDGIHGPGLEILIAIARSLTNDVWVVAPETEQSGAGHSLTLHQPLRVRQVSEKYFAVSGTPTDCVLLGVGHVITDRKPDLVLSGVNRGANLGDDVTYSGTVAAAMEGTLLGIPSIALSQVFRDPQIVPWQTATAFGAEVIRKVTAQGWGRNVLMNVNFPPVGPDQVTGVEATRQGRRKIGDGLIERLDPRGKPYLWIGPQRNGPDAADGTDIAAIDRNAVSVTPLCIDLTDQETLKRLQSDLSV